MYKDYNETEFFALNITLNDYQKSRILAAQNLRTDVAKFYPCELSFTVQDDRHLDLVDVILQHEHQDTFTIEVSYRDKFYALTSNDYSKFKNISNYDRRKIRDDVEAPNRVGVLSTKKIQDWIVYHESIYNKVKAISDEKSAKIDDFLESIEPLPFTYRDGKLRGEIVKNNIKFSYYISEGCISKNLELISTTATIKNFLKLSDNSITVEKP